jgi:hypothetical protein
LSILSCTATILAGLWILRNYRRYTCPVFITSATMIASTIFFLNHSWHADIPSHARQMHMIMDIAFIMMSLVLTKCAFKREYLQSLCETNLPNKNQKSHSFKPWGE